MPNWIVTSCTYRTHTHREVEFGFWTPGKLIGDKTEYKLKKLTLEYLECLKILTRYQPEKSQVYWKPLTQDGPSEVYMGLILQVVSRYKKGSPIPHSYEKEEKPFRRTQADFRQLPYKEMVFGIYYQGTLTEDGNRDYFMIIEPENKR
jgi:hypothetical protein